MIKTRPLQGIKVLDLSRLLPGPYCTMLLADLGAEVIKVEEPKVGDYLRSMVPGMYESVNRNKRSITIDLKLDAGRNLLLDLVRKADVLVESFRPGVVQKLGIDYPTLKHINNSLIYCSISGYGQSGPYAQRPGHDINYLAIAGALSIPGELDKEPCRPGLPVADLSSGIFSAFAVLAALMARGQSGEGQYLDVSITDILVSWMSTRAGEFLLGGKLPTEVQEMHHLSPGNAVYRTRDGRKISVGALEEHFWRAMCNSMELVDLIGHELYDTALKRVINSGNLLKIIQEKMDSKTLAEWSEIFDKAGVPFAPVNNFAETFEDQHFQSRSLFAGIHDKDRQELKQVALPVPMEGTDPSSWTYPPKKGEHTDEVLEEFGWSHEDIQRLREDKVI